MMKIKDITGQGYNQSYRMPGNIMNIISTQHYHILRIVVALCSLICALTTDSTLNNPNADNFRSGVYTIIESSSHTLTDYEQHTFEVTFTSDLPTAPDIYTTSIAELSCSADSITISTSVSSSDATKVIISTSGILSSLSRLKVSFLAYATIISSDNLFIHLYNSYPYSNINSRTPYIQPQVFRFSINMAGEWSLVTFFFSLQANKIPGNSFNIKTTVVTDDTAQQIVQLGLESTSPDDTYVDTASFCLIFVNHQANSARGTLTIVANSNSFSSSPSSYFLGNNSWFEASTASVLYGLEVIISDGVGFNFALDTSSRDLTASSNNGLSGIITSFAVLSKLCPNSQPYYNSTDDLCYLVCSGPQQNYQCLTCPSNCNTCSSPSICTNCSSSYYLRNDNLCYSSCQTNYFQQNGLCLSQNCDNSLCQQCSSNNEACILCKDNYSLQQNKCEKFSQNSQTKMIIAVVVSIIATTVIVSAIIAYCLCCRPAKVHTATEEQSKKQTRIKNQSLAERLAKEQFQQIGKPQEIERADTEGRIATLTTLKTRQLIIEEGNQRISYNAFQSSQGFKSELAEDRIQEYGFKDNNLTHKKSRQDISLHLFSKTFLKIEKANVFGFDINEDLPSDNSEWKRYAHGSTLIYQQCLICSQQAVDTETNCGHCFHHKCLELWLKKRQSCPQCQTKITSKVKFICERCQNFFVKIKLKQIGILPSKKCHQCLEIIQLH